MGIQGLLQALKPYSESVHVKKYSGKRVGIDAYSWLHKGAYACGMELRLEDSRSKSRKVPLYVSYCMHRIKMLKYNNVTPVVVFDGGPLPLKASTENERRRRRETNLENAERKHAEGDMLAAQELFQRAVEVTPSMAHELIEVLREEGVEFVVAPYEADAQLAYLAGLPILRGGISAVISEDSDLLAYGCKAVLFKMDRYGQCEEICLPKLFDCDPPPLKALAFKGFTHDLFLGMCVMAGCDFLASVPGIGVKRAHGLLAKYRNISRALSKLKFERPTTFPENYMADFSMAKAIFSHARVYDREKRELVLLNPLPEELLKEFEGNVDFLGPDLPQSRAEAIAEGRLDPITMEAFNSIPSPKTPAMTNGGSKDMRKNTEFPPSPFTPFSMYGLRKESPKLSNLGSFFSPKGSNPVPTQTSPFTMFTSKKKTLRGFDSPPMRSVHTPGRSEKPTASEVEDTQFDCAASSLSEVSHPPGEVDDSSGPSQVTITFHKRRISETQVSVSGSTVNDVTEMDQTFLAQLHLLAGCGREIPSQNSSLGFSQATSSGRGIASRIPFKRKIVETASDSLHITQDDDSRQTSGDVQMDDEAIDSSLCPSAKKSNLIRLRESSADESNCQSAGGEDRSPSSVLTEISPNFENTEDSLLTDMIASAKASSFLPAHPRAGNISVKSRVGKISRSKFSAQNDRSRGSRRPTKVQVLPPATSPGGGILKFFKPVSQ